MPGTAKQDRFMAAVAHGWTPDRVRSPGVAVARKWTRDASAARSGALKRRAQSR